MLARFILFQTLCGAIAMSLIGCSSPPKPAQSTPMRETIESQAGLGREIAKDVFRRTPLVLDNSALIYVNQVGRYISNAVVPLLKCQTASTNADEVRVALVEATTPTIYSLPGGWIILSKPAISAIESEDALAGLIAREIALSLCETGVDRELASQGVDTWMGVIAKLSSLPLAKTEILFADKIALNALYRSGYDVNDYVRYVDEKENAAGRRASYGRDRASVLKVMASKANGANPNVPARANRFREFKAVLNK